MALSDILKKYGEEEGTQISQGIMFPFQKGVDSTSTTQQVYNSATDGIMTMEGKPYTGPTATIQYGTAEQGYPRMLREIEQGELPQFRQEDFPAVGEGITETPTPVTPPTTQPVEEEQPTIDPCPPGFVLDPVQGVCVPIEKPKDEGPDEIINKPRDIGATAKATTNIAKTAIEQGALDTPYGQDVNLTIDNSTILSSFGFLGKFLDNALIKGPADNRLLNFGQFTNLPTSGILATKNPDGTINVNITEQGKYNFGQIQTDESLRGNLATTQKTDSRGNIIMGPNNAPMIVGPISVNTFGKTTDRTITAEERERNRVEAERRRAAEQASRKAIPSTAPRSVSGEGLLGGGPGQIRDDRKEAREFKERFGKEKSQQQLKQERDKIEKDLDALLADKITPAQKEAAKKTTGGNANKSDKGKIVCTMMNESYGFGSFRNKIWLAHSRNLSKEYEVGYHALFLPLVKYAKQKGFTNTVVKNVLEHIARHRTLDIRKQKYNKVDVLGRTYRTILEPLCYITGRIKLWKKK